MGLGGWVGWVGAWWMMVGVLRGGGELFEWGRTMNAGVPAGRAALPLCWGWPCAEKRMAYPQSTSLHMRRGT